MGPSMRDIKTSHAKGHVPETPDGIETQRRQVEIDAAIAAMRTLRKNTGKVTREELLSFRHEGHRY